MHLLYKVYKVRLYKCAKKYAKYASFSLGFPENAAILPMSQEKSTFWGWILAYRPAQACISGLECGH